MTFLFFQPSMIVPSLLFLLILLVLIAIIGVSINQARRRKKMEREVRRMKKMAAAVSNVSLVGEAMQKKEEEIEEKVKSVKNTAKKKESGDKTIYDDRKKLNSWQVHLSDTYKAMKKKNPKTTFQAAMKAAKKTYKKKK